MEESGDNSVRLGNRYQIAEPSRGVTYIRRPIGYGPLYKRPPHTPGPREDWADQISASQDTNRQLNAERIAAKAVTWDARVREPQFGRSLKPPAKPVMVH